MNKREIKFRCWTPHNEKMYQWNELEEAEIGQMLKDPQQGEKVMQYTGLKDKNGKEIYESDIVELENGDICQIVWNGVDGQWDLEEPATIEYDAQAYEDEVGLHNHCAFKIIGNIYQDPELL